MSLDAGTLRVRPGAALPTVESTRREWAPLVGRGQPADRLAERLAMVYTLCGGAHRVAAAHAVAAAMGRSVEVLSADRQALRIDTLREHLRRLWLDAPRLVDASEAPDPAELAGCPLLRDADALEPSRGWIESQVLGGRAETWLERWNADLHAHALRWSAEGRSWPARWLARQRERLGSLRQPVATLAAQASASELQGLAAALDQQPGFAMAPLWRGRTAETGCWTRQADPHALGGDSPYAELWLRHAARIADLARLLADGGEAWLAQGALALGNGAGLGWCEMARGLLVHRVRLADDGTVADNRLIAPTEWNFHPLGSAAQLLAMLDRGAGPSLVASVVAAYDPCVNVELAGPAEAERA